MHIFSPLSSHMHKAGHHSSDQRQLTEKRARRKRTGNHAFSVCTPRLWNALPHTIQDGIGVASFKTSLKTYYFRQAYTD